MIRKLQNCWNWLKCDERFWVSHDGKQEMYAQHTKKCVSCSRCRKHTFLNSLFQSLFEGEDLSENRRFNLNLFDKTYSKTLREDEYPNKTKHARSTETYFSLVLYLIYIFVLSISDYTLFISTVLYIID